MFLDWLEPRGLDWRRRVSFAQRRTSTEATAKSRAFVSDARYSLPIFVARPRQARHATYPLSKMATNRLRVDFVFQNKPTKINQVLLGGIVNAIPFVS